MSKSINILRKPGSGIYEDKDAGVTYIGSSEADASIVMDGKNVTVTPGAGGSLKTAVSGVDDIISTTTPPWLAAMPLPNMPSKIIMPNKFPYFNYIIPITTIGVLCTVLLKEGNLDE